MQLDLRGRHGSTDSSLFRANWALSAPFVVSRSGLSLGFGSCQTQTPGQNSAFPTIWPAPHNQDNRVTEGSWCPEFIGVGTVRGFA